MQPSGERQVILVLRLQSLLGWIISIICCTIPVVIWITMRPINLRFASFTLTMLSLGQIFGLIGLVMYALNLVFATRLRFLEGWFGGLNRVYIAHHVFGGLSLVLISFHPIFLALRYATDSIRGAALLLLPNGLTPIGALFNVNSDFHIDVLRQWAIFFGSLAFVGMVVLLIVTFFIKLPYRVWLFTHKFLGFAFFLAALHILFINSDTTLNKPLRYYILGFAVIGLVAFVYRSLLGKILIRKYQYYVDDVQVVGGSVTQLVMRPVKRKMSYEPGQFVFIRFLFSGVDAINGEWHPFSISSSPHDDYLRLSVKALGDYTNELGKLKKGAIADIEGAYGKFTYTNFKNKNQIWVGGGIGITPFLSMAGTLKPNSGYTVDLYYAVKTRSELIDIQLLADVANAQSGKFRIIPFVSAEHGLMTADIIEKTSNGVKGKEFFICGPPGMMKALRKQLREKGLPNRTIHTEEFAMS
jgi:predicted ferric reductase